MEEVRGSSPLLRTITKTPSVLLGVFVMYAISTEPSKSLLAVRKIAAGNSDEQLPTHSQTFNSETVTLYKQG